MYENGAFRARGPSASRGPSFCEAARRHDAISSPRPSIARHSPVRALGICIRDRPPRRRCRNHTFAASKSRVIQAGGSAICLTRRRSSGSQARPRFENRRTGSGTSGRPGGQLGGYSACRGGASARAAVKRPIASSSASRLARPHSTAPRPTAHGEDFGRRE